MVGEANLHLDDSSPDSGTGEDPHHWSILDNNILSGSIL